MGKLALLLSALALVPSSTSLTRAAHAAPPTVLHPPLTAVQRHYLLLAQTGALRAEQRFGDRHLGWYDARLGDHERYPLATIWDIVPLFQSLDAIAIAEPTPSNRRAVAT